MGNFMASLCVMLSCGGSALTDLQLPTYTVSAACSTTLKLQRKGSKPGAGAVVEAALAAS